MRVLIIDDEAPARELLVGMLGKHPQVCPVGEARSVPEAVALCEQLRPDALFLDIEMGELDGFALLERLAGPPPAVVFVTAHEAFAVPAFGVAAVDYLLKPVHPQRLAAAVEKLERHLCLAQPGQKLYLPTDSGVEAVGIDAITHICADENYTSLFVRGGPGFHLRRSMKTWQTILPASQFLRIHRSLLINRLAIAKINTHPGGEGELLLEGHPAPLPLTRRALQRLRRLLPV